MSKEEKKEIIKNVKESFDIDDNLIEYHKFQEMKNYLSKCYCYESEIDGKFFYKLDKIVYEMEILCFSSLEISLNKPFTSERVDVELVDLEDFEKISNENYEKIYNNYKRFIAEHKKIISGKHIKELL